MQLTYKKIFFYGLPLLVTATIFLLPDRVYAVGISDAFSGMEPACKVLKTNTDAHAIWKTLLTLVNSLIVALLIVVAFVEILHINVNTYGVKKILPTLILAVIAANFSYIVVRFLVDIANIVITVFSENNKVGDMVNNPEIFKFPDFEWTSWFSNLIINLILLASGILMYVMAFLFLIRNWVIYFLAIVSPIAFMAMVLPQTKSLFNQWWQNIFRWVFMPVVSIGLLWLAAQMTPLIAQSAVMGAAIIGAILYFAIIMPFKLGGAVMEGWANVVKKPWAATGGFVGKKIGEGIKYTASNYAQGVWGGFKNWARDKTGMRLFSTGIRSKQYLDRHQEYEKAQEDRVKGQLYHNMNKNPKKANQEVLRRKRMSGMKGEDEEEYKYVFNDFIKRGLNNPKDPDFVKWRKMWEGSGLAKARMQASDLFEKEEENRAVAKAINGGRDPRQKSDAEVTEWREMVKGKLGWTDKDLSYFEEFYAAAKKEGEVYTMVESKGEMDALTKTAEESQRAHAVTELKEMSEALKKVKDNLKSTFGIDLKQIVEKSMKIEDSAWGKTPGRTAAEIEAAKVLQQEYTSKSSRVEQLMKQENILIGRERLTTDNLDEHTAHAGNNYGEMKKIIQAEMNKNGGAVPLSLLHQVVVGADGKTIEGFRALNNVENTRLIGIIAQKTRSRTETYIGESAQAKADKLRYATDTQDKFTVRSAANYQQGTITFEDAEEVGGWRGFVNRRNRYVASDRSYSAGLRIPAEAPILVESKIENADEREAGLIIKAWRDAKPKDFEGPAGLDAILTGKSHDEQKTILYRYYQDAPQNEKNRLIPAIDSLVSKAI